MSGFRSEEIHTIWFGGTGDLTCNFNTAAATFSWTRDSNNKPVHMATIPSTAHKFSAGSSIFVEGSTAYDGLWKINTVPNANSFTLLEPSGGTNTFTAETFTGGGTETGVVSLPCYTPLQLLEFRLKMSATGGASENFTLTLDANKGAAWDDLIYTKDMNAVQYIRQVYYSSPDRLRYSICIL